MSKVDGFDAADNHAGGQQKQALQRGQDQQQQWLLMLEKAYLTLQQDSLERLTVAEENANGDGARLDRTAAPRAASESESAVLAVARQAAASVIAPVASGVSDSDLMVTLNAAAGDASAVKVNLSADPQRLHLRPGVSTGTTTSAERLITQLKPAVLGLIPELKSATLLKTGQGLHLVVRDLQVGDPRQLVERLRNIFAELNMPLARITINGKSAWQETGMKDSARAGDSGSMVNRVF